MNHLIARYSSKLLHIVTILALLVVAVFSTVPSAKADGVDATVTSVILRIRSEPSTSGAIIANVEQGSQLTLTGRDQTGQWVYGKVISGSQNGAVGWASRMFLQLRVDLNVLTLPVVGSNSPANGGTGAPAATNNTPSTTGGTTGGNAAPVVSGRVSGGFEIGAHVAGLDGAAVAAMQQAGMKWAKFQLFAGDGAAYGLIQAAHANGLKVLFGVKGDKGRVLDGGFQSDYAKYVGEIAKAGADAIEVWNEMNIDREWPQGQINPTLYVQLLAKAYNAIKSNNPNTIVITGAPAPTGAEGAFGLDRVWNDDRYMAGMAAAGAASYADCIGLHYNEGIVSPNQNSGGWTTYPTNYFSTMLARGLAKFRGKKACFTELGFLSPEGFGGLPGGFSWAANTSVDEQAAWLAQAAVKASASGRVRLMIIWNLNFTNWGDDPMAGYAIIRPGGGCPACEKLGSVMRR